jgi:glutamate synthase domain-containing protein 1/glutamate synthase domain-containing protein 3
MDQRETAERVIASRRGLIESLTRSFRKAEAEGGCGVIGMACSVPIPGRHLLQSLIQMRNRGNGKGGGVALVGLEPAQFGVTPDVLREDYLLTIAYLDASIRFEVEKQFVEPVFIVDHTYQFEIRDFGLEIAPPQAVAYFARVRAERLETFRAEKNLSGLPAEAVADEFVYQNTYRLNQALYASLGEKRAFVLSHGKDMLVLKMVGYGDDVIRAYQLEDVRAHVWIGHHRYPTKGRVWHPGGAHPFTGMHEALVHNGDFANYASVCTYLAQRNLYPLFLTDTEVSVLVFDLLYRTYGYPLEYVIESLAPTTERDFSRLPPEKQELYRMLQTVHIHGSPDGPWFFLIAQSEANGRRPRHARLVGITDTSMLRPQVFALQQGGPGQPSIGFAASEKQAIDAALESLAREDGRFWARPDRVWNARGGSHTDGGAFMFDVRREAAERAELICTDKFGRRIEVGENAHPYPPQGCQANSTPLAIEGPAPRLFEQVIAQLPSWTYAQMLGFLEALVADRGADPARPLALETLTLLIDRRYPTGNLRRSSLLALCDQALASVFDAIRAVPSPAFAFHAQGGPLSAPRKEGLALGQAVVIDARTFEPQGPNSLAQEIVRLVERGFRHVIVAHARGHRFIGNGLGPGSDGVQIEVYGSSGDYLASGIDGAEIIVHGNGQDQLAQIMKSGRLVVYGDVGQTFMYAAKGGEVFVLGNAAGRPLINAVGKPRVVINGTCLDYLAESFMAGDPLNGGGFVVLNGVGFGPDGLLMELDTPYPGGNLFSLASGGAIFVRDPHHTLGDDQLNGGEFAAFTPEHWELIRPMLEENERRFGISVAWLLQVNGDSARPEQVYRVIVPSGHTALMPEEAWVTN